MATTSNQNNTTQEVVVEVRPKVMALLWQQGERIRDSHFLKPSFPTNQTPVPKLPTQALNNPNRSNKGLVKAKFHGWQKPLAEWCEWVERLRPIHEATWKKAGIFEAVKATAFTICQDKYVILDLAQKWHGDSKTFIFEWGEASVTLEDVCVLGGFSVTGDSICIRVSPDMNEVDERIKAARKVINQTPTRKCTFNRWLRHFIDEGNGFEDIEHEAFLIYWLSKFVFPKVKDSIRNDVHSLAIQLARGTRVALAPAILASIYIDLKRLKKALSRPDPIGKEKIELWSLMHLVQAWVCERFPKMGFRPNNIQAGEPRLARWHNLKGIRLIAAGEIMDKAKDNFRWRPYCKVINNWTFNEFYRIDGEWVEIKIGSRQEVEPFAMFIRHSELVGLEGIIEQYLPYRVAPQFGMNQDVPGFVPRFNQTIKCAWDHYNRPFGDQKVYIPSRHLEGDVTFRYACWFYQARSTALVISGPSSSQHSPNDENYNDKELRIHKKAKLVQR